MLDFIVLLVCIYYGGVVEPQTLEQEIISWVVILAGLVFEIIRFSVWSKREIRKREWEERKAYYDIVERERRKYGEL